MDERVVNLIDRLKETASEFDTEYADYESLYDSLQYRPVIDKGFFWAYNGDILSTSEENIKALAKYYKDTYGNDAMVGYFDPVDDEADGTTDEFTGSYSLDLD